ncbi:MAG: hypothetical protein V4496_07755 [Pseudomonadota bacterium]
MLDPRNELHNPILSTDDIERGVRPNEQIDFSDILQHIANTPELVSQGSAFTQVITSMAGPIQELVDHHALSAEEIPNLKQHLLSLLTHIAPHSAEYTGEGISQTQFDEYAQPFLAFFPRQQHQHRDVHIEQCESWGCIMLILFITGMILIICGGCDLDLSKRDYDDDQGGGLRRLKEITLQDKHHYHSDARNERLEKDSNNLFIAGGALLALPILTLLYRFGTQLLQQYRDRARHPEIIPPTITAPRERIRTAVSEIYSEYCKPTKTVEDFENNTQAAPVSFNELAKKIFVSQLTVDKAGYDKNDIILTDILRNFDQLPTPNGQKFNQALRESTDESMRQCLERLITIPVWNRLTLQANHILGRHALIYLLDLITQLRNELRLLPWKTSSLIDDPDILLEEAIIIYAGESSSSAFFTSANSTDATTTPIVSAIPVPGSATETL